MARPTHPSPLDEQTLLQLQGGVRGRFARSFSVLQGSVDTLERYLQRHATGTVLDDTEPLFENIHDQIRELEHLSGNAVDLLNSAVLYDPQLLQPMDIAAFLRAFCSGANEELACQGVKACVTLELPEAQQLYLPASETLLNALFVNLVTNSVRARPDTAITVRCDAGNTLYYRDTGPGPGPDVQELLCGGSVSLALLRRGRLGLLVALTCAQDLGWPMAFDPKTGDGFAVVMHLPQPLPATAAALHGGSGKALEERLRRLLRRELEQALHA